MQLSLELYTSKCKLKQFRSFHWLGDSWIVSIVGAGQCDRAGTAGLLLQTQDGDTAARHCRGPASGQGGKWLLQSGHVLALAHTHLQCSLNTAQAKRTVTL